MHINKTAFVFLLATTVPAARADWQYTHWGMTPEEVVAASNGKAGLLATPTDELHKDQHLCLYDAAGNELPSATGPTDHGVRRVGSCGTGPVISSTLVEGTYEASDLTFKSIFTFNGDRKLAAVHLTLQQPTLVTCGRLVKLLNDAHGVPISSSDRPDKRLGTHMEREWMSKKGDRVKYWDLYGLKSSKSLDAELSLCGVSYLQVVPQAKSGL